MKLKNLVALAFLCLSPLALKAMDREKTVENPVQKPIEKAQVQPTHQTMELVQILDGRADNKQSKGDIGDKSLFLVIFEKEIADFLLSHNYFHRVNNETIAWRTSKIVAQGLKELLVHFKISALLKNNETKSRAEIMLLDLFHWARQQEDKIVALEKDQGKIEDLAALFNSYRLRDGIKLKGPDTWLAPEIADFFGLNTSVGSARPGNRFELYEEPVFLFYKKLFHCIYNLHLKWGRKPFVLLNEDNTPNDIHIVNYTLFIEEQLSQHDIFFDVFELAHHWNLKAVMHALVRVLEKDVEVGGGKIDEANLNKLAKSIPFVVYPELLKNHRNARFVLRILNRAIALGQGLIKESTPEGQDAEQEKALTAKIKNDVKELEHEERLNEYLDPIIDGIEYFWSTDFVDLNPWLEVRLRARLAERVPFNVTETDNPKEAITEYINQLAKFIEKKPLDETDTSSAELNKARDASLVKLMPSDADAMAYGSYRTTHPEMPGCLLFVSYTDGSLKAFVAYEKKLIQILRGPHQGEGACVPYQFVKACSEFIVASDVFGRYKVWDRRNFNLIEEGSIDRDSFGVLVDITCLSDRRIVFACSKGLVLYDLKTQSHSFLPIQDPVYLVREAGNNHLVVGLIGKVILCDIRTQKCQTISDEIGKITNIKVNENNIEVLYNNVLKRCFVPQVMPLPELDWLRLAEYFFKKGEWKRAFDCFYRAHDKKDSQWAAAARLGQMHINGWGTEKNVVQGKNLLVNAKFNAQKDRLALWAQAEASVSLAEMHLTHLGFKAIKGEGKANFAWLCHLTGRYMFSNNQNFIRAVRYLKLAANQTDNPWVRGWAFVALAHYYERLNDASFERAIEYFKKAADQSVNKPGQQIACERLAAFYEAGEKVAYNPGLAERYRARAQQLKIENEEAARLRKAFIEATQLHDAEKIAQLTGEIEKSHCDPSFTYLVMSRVYDEAFKDDNPDLEVAITYLKDAAHQKVNICARARASLYLLKLLFFPSGSNLVADAETQRSYVEAALEGDSDTKEEANMFITEFAKNIPE